MLAFCALALGGYGVASGEWHATPVLSGSMRPGLQPGDVVITHRVPISSLQVRDVIVFRPPDEGGKQTVHRIVKIAEQDGKTSITTRGDANSVDDATVTALTGASAYRVTRIVPLLGYPAVWLQNGKHGLLVIGLGVILLVAGAITVLRREKQPESATPGDQSGSEDAPAGGDGDTPDDTPSDTGRRRLPGWVPRRVGAATGALAIGGVIAFALAGSTSAGAVHESTPAPAPPSPVATASPRPVPSSAPCRVSPIRPLAGLENACHASGKRPPVRSAVT